MDIVCLGELLIDMFPAEVGRSLVEVSAWSPKPGGAPANVAVAARRLGAHTAFIGKVGDDGFGHHLADILCREGVDVSGMRYDTEARTGMAFIAMTDVNTYDILFYRNPGADMRLRPDEVDAELLGSARAFHFGSLSLIQEPSRSATLEAVQLARQGGALISFDVNYRGDLWSREAAYERVMDTLHQVDLLKINETEAEILGGSDDLEKVARGLLVHGPKLCVVTLGPMGSLFQTADGGALVPPFKVETVDATGCGDAFVAALLCQLVVQADWRTQLNAERLCAILRYANAAGALTSLQQGVIPALPTAAQVQSFLSSHASGEQQPSGLTDEVVQLPDCR